MELIELFCIICFTALCTAIEESDIPKPAIKLNTAWSQVFYTERVDLSCTVEGSSEWKFTWFRDSKEIQADHVVLSTDGTTLSIPAASIADSGKYTCKGQHKNRTLTTHNSNELTLKVNGIPKPAIKLNTAWSQVFYTERVELSCTVEGSSEWKFTWFRDSKEIQADHVVLTTDGTSLSIPAVTMVDAGKYMCKGQHKNRTLTTYNSDKHTLNVNEIPVPSVALQTPWSAVFSSESVELNCSMQDSPDHWTYTWYRGGQEVVVQEPVVSFGIDGSDLKISLVSLEHAGQYTCTGQLKGRPVKSEHSIPLSLEVKEIPVPSVALQTPWSAVFTSESVELKCSMQDSPDLWNYTWYRGGQEVVVQEPGVSFGSDGSDLTISPVSLEHVGQYTCTGQLKGRPVKSEHSIPLSLKVKDIPKPAIKLNTAWSQVFYTERVDLSCTVEGSSEWKFTWFRDSKEIQADHVVLSTDGTTLSIPAASIVDSGKYMCKGQHKNRTLTTHNSNELTIKVNKFPVPSVALQTPWSAVFSSESVELNCSMQDSPDHWTYTWYRGGQEVVVQEPGVSFGSDGSDLKISPVSLEHAGQYTCTGQLKGRPFKSEHSNTLSLEVKEIPVPSVALQTRWSPVFASESVELKCSMQDSPDLWNYTWFRGGQKMGVQEPGVSFGSDGSDLKISPVSLEHAGQYTCTGQLKGRPIKSKPSKTHPFEVKEIPVPLVALQTQWPDVFPSEKVEMNCKMQDSPDPWTYTWYRGGQEVAVQGPGVSFGSDGSDLKISPVSLEHAGQYTCTGQLKGRPFKSEHSNTLSLEVKEIPVPSVALQTRWSPVFASESVELKCSMQDSPDLWNYTWFRGGQKMGVQEPGVSFGSDGSDLKISPVSLEHAGQYTCTGQLKGRPIKSKPSKTHPFEVKEIPVPLVALQTQWPDVFPSEKVEMNCKMQDSPDPWTYTWYRGGQEVAVQGPGVSFGSDGSQLVISSARLEHAGEYNCTGQLKGRPPVKSEHSNPVSLFVYDKKPTPELIQDLGYPKMYAKEPINFSCKVNTSSGWEFYWFKDSARLPNQGETYTIPSASSDNAGAHQCRATRGQEPQFSTEDSNTISINVGVRPWATVTLLTGWSEVFSADRLDLKCEVHGSEDTWNYTWFGGSEQSPLSFNAKHPVMSKDVNQSHYSCMGNRSSRPLYSQRSEPFKTTNLLLKRRVLLSICGCLFFGIIAVFIGCIVMRITRKPVTSEDEPKEINLFLTRAELQASDVAPCPLAEYVSDEEKPALTKDAEDIDTVCHESTPLPLSFSEVEAETSETNGGLKSFKY